MNRRPSKDRRPSKEPALPDTATIGQPRVEVAVPRNGKVGFVWGDGGVVTAVTVGGLAEKAGAVAGWRLANVQGKRVRREDPKSVIGDWLVGIRRGGKPYGLVFETLAAAPVEAGPESTLTGPAAALHARLEAILDSAPRNEYDMAGGATEISDWLLLGTAAVAKAVLSGERPDLQVSAVLNVVRDPDDPDDWPSEETLERAGVRAYGGFWASDRADYDICSDDYFLRARPFLVAVREQGLRVLVHCSMGVNRSAAIACAFLVEREGAELCDAAALLHHARGGVLGNEGFRRQLAALAARCGQS